MRENKVNLLVVILNGICAVVWIINACFHFIYHSPRWILYLNSICAIIWTLVFIFWIIRYKLAKRRESEEE